MLRLDRVLHWLLMAVCLVALLPGFIYLGRTVQIALLVALLLACLDPAARWRTGRYLFMAVLVGLGVVTLTQVSIADVVTPLVEVLCLLLCARLWGPRGNRQIMQGFVLAVVILGASSLLSLGPVYLLALVLLAFLLPTGLVVMTFVSAEPRLVVNSSQVRLMTRIFLVLPVASVVLMAGLFFVLPRTQYPLWNFLNPVAKARAGLADQVRPGSVTGLALNEEVAFRAESPPLPRESLYWRGLVLNRLQGQVWTRDQGGPGESLLPRDKVRREMSILPASSGNNYLVSLDGSSSVAQIRYRQDQDGVFRVSRSGNKAGPYRIEYHDSYQRRLQKNVDFYLGVEGNVDPQVLAVAANVRNVAGGFAEKISFLEDFFRQQQLTYAAENLPRTETPVRTFLFESKRGYCEYFASSFAMILRLAGIPSRLVGGYLGGVYNEFGHYYLISENMAHVWVEALDEQSNWQRIDPSRLAVNAEGTLIARTSQGLSRWQVFTDAFAHYWSSKVLNYDLQSQLQLFRSALRGELHLEKFRRMLFVLGVVAVLAVGGGCFYRRYFTHAWMVSSYYRHVSRLYGRPVARSTGLYEAAELTRLPICRDIAAMVGQGLYADEPMNWARRREIRRLLADLRRCKGEDLGCTVDFSDE